MVAILVGFFRGGVSEPLSDNNLVETMNALFFPALEIEGESEITWDERA